MATHSEEPNTPVGRTVSPTLLRVDSGMKATSFDSGYAQDNHGQHSDKCKPSPMKLLLMKGGSMHGLGIDKPPLSHVACYNVENEAHITDDVKEGSQNISPNSRGHLRFGYAIPNASSFLSSMLSELRKGVGYEGCVFCENPITEYVLLNLEYSTYEKRKRARPQRPATVEAFDMADRYENAQVMSVEIATTQQSFLLFNFPFKVNDLEDDGLNRAHHTNFIHSSESTATSVP
ncbi:hypothetical protein GQ44DRAFT_763743 [Phaeosphaeriaceae sp. PMI808]|nr:hypothetical protein GQ44DRAFT_763743 [Phaeosphaeriaceae sp. PMI808]